MSTQVAPAFALTPTGKAPCGHPYCVLDDFHEGAHEFAPTPTLSTSGYQYRCVICKRAMVLYGDWIPHEADLCDAQECLQAYCALRTKPATSHVCPCPQRPYPHDLSVHHSVRQEAYNPKLRHVWPWSLMLSPRVEPSTEGASHA